MSELVSSRIHLLPEHLVDQIKAGEVIERPANLIKEILENSLDAQSKNISIHLIAGGIELLRFTLCLL
jgi:DNA mismatch repair protein MutL